MVAAPANTGAKMAQPEGCGYKRLWNVNWESLYYCSLCPATRLWVKISFSKGGTHLLPLRKGRKGGILWKIFQTA